MKLNETQELRAKIEANLAKWPSLAQLREPILSNNPNAQSAWNLLVLLSEQLAEQSNSKKFTIQNLAVQVMQAFGQASQIVEKEAAALEKKGCVAAQALGQGGDASAEQAQADCEAKIASLKELKGDFDQIVKVVNEALQTTVELAFAPRQVEMLEGEIKSLESNMIFIRQIMSATGVK